MSLPFIEKKTRKLRILVAPLDWGLGHATRCIPVIRELLHYDVDVWLACEGAQETLLKKEFPQLRFLSLPGYRIHYGKSSIGLSVKIFFQIFKILKSIRNENKWLNEMLNEYGFDAVISDNRYGLYHKKILSVFITHQLNIKTPMGKWSEKILQRINYDYINRFSECWVPDEEGENNLAGKLSHPKKNPSTPIKYIGLLSRFYHSNDQYLKNHLIVILSGPEPQRSIFENIIVEQIAHYNGTAVVVRGLPNSLTIIPSTNSIRFYNHLPAKELSKEILKAEFVIARSGYSTIMDMMALKKKCIFIPTPGQSEQGYLAKYISEKNLACYEQQKDFSLEKILATAKNFPYRFADFDRGTKLKIAVEKLVHSLK